MSLSPATQANKIFEVYLHKWYNWQDSSFETVFQLQERWTSIALQIPEDIRSQETQSWTIPEINWHGRLISLLLLSSSLKGCELYAFCGALFGITSMITLMVIALDRYFVITKPLASVGVMSKKKALIILVGVWLYSLAWSLPPFFGWSKLNGMKVFFPS